MKTYTYNITNKNWLYTSQFYGVPSIKFKEETTLQIQLVWFNGVSYQPFIEWYNQNCVFKFVIDCDNILFYETTLINNISGSIQSIKITGLPIEPERIGKLLLVNKFNQFETVDYVGFKNQEFIVNHELQYVYEKDDVVYVIDPVLIYVENSDIDQSELNQGIIRIDLNANSWKLLKIINARLSIPCRWELLVYKNGSLIDSIDGQLIIEGSIDGFDIVPPTIPNNYYTKEEIQSLLHSHVNKEILDQIEVALTNSLKSNYDTAYNHSQSNHPFGNVGTKEVDETNIADGKVLSYNASLNKVVYSDASLTEVDPVWNSEKSNYMPKPGSANNGNIARFDSNRNVVDSGISSSSLVRKTGTPTNGRLASWYNSNTVQDSGINVTDIQTKPSSAVEGNLAKFDANRNVVDSNIDSSKVVTIDGSPSFLRLACFSSNSSNEIKNSGIYADEVVKKSGTPMPGNFAVWVTQNTITDVAMSELYSVWDPLIPPESPSQYDDEFNGTSLDSKWYEFDPNNILTLSVDSDYGAVKFSTSARSGNNVIGIYQNTTIPDGYCLFTRCWFHFSNYNLYCMPCITFWTNPNNLSSSIYTFGIYSGNDSQGVAVRSAYYTNHNTHGGNYFYSNWKDNIISSFYIRVRRSGNNYYCAVSYDGLSWYEGGSYASISSYNAIGISTDALNSSVEIYFDFFRLQPSTKLMGRKRKIYG